MNCSAAYAQRAIVTAARLAGANAEQLMLDWRNKPLVHARWAVMVALHRRGMGKRSIGQRLRRDKNTVHYGIRMGKARLADPEFAAMFAQVDAA